MAADTPYRGPEPPNTNDNKHPGVDDYSGLQVVETGLEVVPPCPLPEALPPHLQPQYGEYKPWAQYSPPPPQLPPQPLPPHPGYPYPASVDSGLVAVSPPYGGGMMPDHRYHGGHNPFEPPRKTTGNGLVCGLRKVVFWIIIAIVVFAIVAAVAIGLGVGLGTRSDAPAASTTTATSSAAPTATDSLPAATATSTAGPELNIVCPSANRTLYSLASSSAGADQKFLVLCGRDYNSWGGAQDMVSVNTTTFEGCLEECSGQEDCVAVGWGNYYGTNTCWLKSAIGEPNWSEGWYSAVAE
ncbi:hypothetical protein VMCG_00092 [Cytospora schulzeri]|uniref:Apple domain-containing protein n=1 Tax=Cytospora schulzeri TaxID=448051 RepID=A0A423X8R2_9PEZI|nr:hypothetical protein VMCG_00092 [Valsa malicola]